MWCRWYLARSGTVLFPVLQLLCIVGLLRSVGNPIGSLLMAKARVDISFKFNVFKTFLFIPAIFIGGHQAGAIGVTLGFLLVQVINTILSYFVMIKPVLGSSYRPVHAQSVAAVISLFTDPCGELCAGRNAAQPTVARRVAGDPGSGRSAGVRGDDCGVAPSVSGGNKTPALPQ
ncbi:colanic acid exporter [Citrobacter braakii]|nr:colanic acid exporter [Citrobacter braakii]